MGLVTVVGLYTSRVILQTLGVEDFGIYNVAGSAVALFTFITGALGQSSSRYITVELGKTKDNELNRLIRCFKTTRCIHAILALVMALVCETLGLWVLSKSAIPSDRQYAAFWVFQISTIATMVNIMQIPFNALIIAHERMAVFAYISVFDSIARLAVCFMIIKSPIDKLIYYAILLFIVQICVYVYYRYYCRNKFKECRGGYALDKQFFKPILSFSFWNLFGSLSYHALTQGATIIISLFFGPAVVTARAIASQVKNHVVAFVNNFRTAINPQILKRNAAGEIESYKQLLLMSANFTFYLMLLFVLPLFFVANFVLELWLEEVPKYTTEFLQISLFEMLFYVYDIVFYQIFQAEGRLKENAIICPTMDLVGMVIVYVVYLFGGDVLAIAWLMLILTFLQGVIVKPWLAVRLFNFKWMDFIKVFYNNLKVMVSATIIPLFLYLHMNHTALVNFVLIAISILAVLISSFYIGMTKDERMKIKVMVESKLRR